MSPLPVPVCSTEDQILLCAAHPRLSQERQERLARLLQACVNWPELLLQLERHEIAPLLSHHLQSMSEVRLPETARAALKQAARATLVRNLALQQTLRALLDALNQAALPVMPLKGILLTELLYGDLALRPMADIDLLVRPEDLEAATHTLLRVGCERIRPLNQDADLYHHLFTTTGRSGASVLVELHWDLTWNHVSRLDVEQVWARAECTRWQGRGVWTMTPSDLFLYLCLHAVKDGLGAVKPLVDIALMLERFGHSLDWDTLAETVRAAQVRVPITLSLLQTQTLVGAVVPPEFLKAIRPRRGVSWYVNQFAFRWRGGVLHTPPAFLDTPMTTIFFVLWEDSLRGKLRHVRRMLVPSATLRARWTQLPATTSVWRWYPAWLWRIGTKLIRQLIRSRHD